MGRCRERGLKGTFRRATLRPASHSRASGGKPGKDYRKCESRLSVAYRDIENTSTPDSKANSASKRLARREIRRQAFLSGRLPRPLRRDLQNGARPHSDRAVFVSEPSGYGGGAKVGTEKLSVPESSRAATKIKSGPKLLII